MDVSEQVASAPATRHTRSTLRTLTALFFVSLAVRLALWAPVVHFDVLPLYDEMAYMRRALAYKNVVTSYLGGALFRAQPPQADLEQAYLHGVWPPLHPLLIGLAFTIVGHSLALARLVIVLQSAVTTCVVFALASRLATRRAGLLAAGIHVVYPSFLAYSHLLWSETTYILACLGALYFAVRVVDEKRPKRQVLLALFTGASLGLAGLARAAVLPLLVVVPLWLLWRLRHRKRRLLAPAAVLAAYVVVLLPWQMTLWAREQRFVLLTTKTGYYLYEGNNPWYSDDGVMGKVRTAVAEYVDEHGVSRGEAGRALAIAHIREDFRGFLQRACGRARSLWGLDWYIMRHVLYCTYPPLPHGVPVALLIVLAASLACLMTCIIYGLCCCGSECRHRSLLLAAVLFSMGPNLLSVTNSRMTVPLLAMLLAPAGVGLAALAARRAWLRGAALLALTAAGLWALNPRLPRTALGVENQASAYYGPVLHRLERVFGQTRASAHDCVFLRHTGQRPLEALRVALRSDPYRFVDYDSRSIVIRDMEPGRPHQITLRAPHALPQPPVLELTLLDLGDSVRIHPVQPDAWQRWQPTGLKHLEYCWSGTRGTPGPPKWMSPDKTQDAGR